MYAGPRLVGEITSALVPPGRPGVVALGFVKREHSEPGTSLEVGSESGVLATVVELPFGMLRHQSLYIARVEITSVRKPRGSKHGLQKRL